MVSIPEGRTNKNRTIFTIGRFDAVNAAWYFAENTRGITILSASAFAAANIRTHSPNLLVLLLLVLCSFCAVLLRVFFFFFALLNWIARWETVLLHIWIIWYTNDWSIYQYVRLFPPPPPPKHQTFQLQWYGRTHRSLSCSSRLSWPLVLRQNWLRPLPAVNSRNHHVIYSFWCFFVFRRVLHYRICSVRLYV